MAICVNSNLDGLLQIQPTPIGSCTEYALITAQEYANLTPLYTPADAALIGSAIVAVWGIAFGFRALFMSTRL